MAVMTIKHGDVFAYIESEAGYSLDNGTLLPLTASAVTGEVLGRVTATGKWAPIDFAAVDGTEIAKGVLFNGAPVSVSDQAGVVCVRHAIVKDGSLTWPAGATGPQIAAAIEQLKAVGIVARATA